MKVTRVLLAVLAILAMTSCRTTMQFNSMTDSSQTIERNRNIFIANVNDGAFEGRIYAGSGATVNNFFRLQMQPFAAQITSENEAYYIVKPTITHWEPRRAEWSGRPTRVKIHVSIIEAATGNEVVNKELSIKGRSVTMVPQSAEGLAQYMIRDFCDQIFAQ